MKQIQIAIVGMGPRGLTILERLLEHAGRLSKGVSLQIEVFDCGEGGQGVHRSDQPDHLLINTVASQVTMFAPTSVAGGDDDLSLVQWAHASGYRRVADRFVRNPPDDAGVAITQADHLPRSLLGEYLSWVYRRVVAGLPDTIQVTHRRVQVVDLVERDGRFDVVTEGGDTRSVDYVFLTTGHGRRKPTEEDQAFGAFVERHLGHNPRLGYFASPYPVETLDAIWPAATVAVQGFGLTAHDVISSLTLGRGGRYVEEDGRLRYLRSGLEPHIVLFSRNCLPFAARGVNQKGIAGRHHARFFTKDAVEAKRRAALLATGDPRIDFRRDVVPLAIKEMAYAYRTAREGREIDVDGFEPTPDELRAIDAILWPLKGQRFDSFSAFREFFDKLLRDDLDEAFKGNLSSPVKAATDVLRDTREALRVAVEYGGLTPDSHRYFVEDFNATTNRVSFGPPKQRNVEFLALQEAGLIDIAGGPGARVVADDAHASFRIEAAYANHTEHTYADALVIARLDAYSPLTDASRLTANLMKRGLVRPYLNGDYHPGGIEIDAALHPVGASGEVRRNLWAVGFLVEGPHFYTHALPRPQITSRQTLDAERCVLELLDAIAALTRDDDPHGPAGKCDRAPSAADGPATTLPAIA
ncbi:FAD/NAD(P)-binding protein [Burkholderia plantarii]|uniref:FAD/NAD(P)-binding protein n=1 Tax=Burkholderia plantarii TaxID=41899 RepID=UPI0018DD4C00|nr:FAD/NAD(P)-binding domain-containing protein [Burkholderia plantarii]MBI0326862.1 FAD/NAD(P)-binding protein [Burkholderia plantarii]